MPREIDIVILSYAKDDERKKLTIQTIDTLLNSEDSETIQFNVVVIESNRKMHPYQYEYSTTIYPTVPFGFHKYLNIGINATSSPYVCLCNNDLIFHTGWATQILKEMDKDPGLKSVHPSSPGYKRPEGFTGDDSELGNFYGQLFGWCIFTRRTLYDIIGPLDEKFTFWFSDRDYIHTLKKFGIENRLLESSVVEHIGSGSWTLMTEKENYKFTQLPRLYFSYKWHHHSYIRYKLEVLLNKIKLMTKS